MRQAAEEDGRTVLYVSHNMNTIRQLCRRCLVLDQGKIVYDGNVDGAIAIYLKSAENAERTSYDVKDIARNKVCSLLHKILHTELVGSETNHYFYGDRIKLRISWISEANNNKLQFKTLFISTSRGPVGVAFSGEVNYIKGANSIEIEIDTRFFIPGTYICEFMFYSENEEGNVQFHDICRALFFTVEDGEKSVFLRDWYSDWGASVLPCVAII